MSRFLFIVYVLPILLTLVGAFLGLASASRALKSFLAILVTCEIGFIAALTWGGWNDYATVLIATFAMVLVMMASIWVSFFMSLTARRRSPAPIVIVAKHVAAGTKSVSAAYQNLDEETKSKVRRAARSGVKFAARHAADHFTGKGWTLAAGAIRGFSKFV
ncbi:MAG: hypothetical protein WCI89_02075 [bacterium]